MGDDIGKFQGLLSFALHFLRVECLKGFSTQHKTNSQRQKMEGMIGLELQC